MKPGKVRKSGKALSSLRQKGIKITGKWKPVSLDPSFFTDGKMDEMICFEELSGYKLVRSSKELTTRKRKRGAGEEDAELEDSEEHFSKGKKSKKRKKKLEARRAKEEESEDEMEDVFLGGEEENQRDAVEKEKEEKEEEEDTEPSVEPMAVQTPKKKKKKRRQKKKKPVEIREEPVATKSSKKTKNWAAGVLGGAAGKDVDVSAWKDLCAPEPVLQALSNLGFSAPTPIQALALPSAIRDKLDILGAAETGSGKTLAFAIPMIHAILEWRKMRESGVTEEMEENEEAEKEASDQEEAEKGASDQEEAEKEASDQEEAEKEASDQEEAEKEASDQEEAEKEASDQEEAEKEASDQEEAEKEASDREEVEKEASDREEDRNMDNKEDEEDSENDYDDDESSALGCVKIVEDVDISFNPVTSNTSQQCCNKRPLLGLVVTPTRELAVQVKHHIDAVAKFTGIRTAIIVGGMAPQKQERLLNRRPEIVIATPGRLWEMIREKHPHLSNLKKLRCLVIDEADRMVEKGHYAELTQLLEMLSDTHYNPKRQTFVFSATLTLIHQAPSRLLQKKNFKRMDKDSKLESLMQKVGMKGKPKVIDLTRKQATVETLTETRIHCSTDEKDFYLYYFLLQYPGRTMVFANSIDCIKRLTSLLTILECNPLQLHANMHQKQRLKNLERFAERERCVLLTTDVAARGLDIPNIQHVLHYQVPRTSETYVHRSGRTARASSDGLTLLLIGPDDVVNYRKIFRTLEKNDELPFFPVESKCMNGIKERVSLARQIEKAEYFNSKTKQQNSWIQQAAEALEMDIDDDLLGGKADEEEDSAKQKALKFTKKQLKRLLSQPIFRNILKTKYPTKSGQLTLPDLPAARAESALHTLSNQRTKKQKPRP